MCDLGITVDEWINLVNGRDSKPSLRGRLTVLYWRAGLHGGGGGAGPAWPGGISPMITSTKSTHESVPLKHSVARLYIARLC